MGLLPDSSPIEPAHALIWMTSEGLHSLARMSKVRRAPVVPGLVSGLATVALWPPHWPTTAIQPVAALS